MKELVEYSKKKNEQAKKDLTFSLTTNLVLMTKEIAHYLASVGGFAVLCSLDGPKEIYDEYRVMHDGSGSFSKAIAGLKTLVEAYGEKVQTLVAVNGVLTLPPLTQRTDLMLYRNFIKAWTGCLKNFSVQLTYVKYMEGSELDRVFKEAHGKSEEEENFYPLNDWIEQ